LDEERESKMSKTDKDPLDDIFDDLDGDDDGTKPDLGENDDLKALKAQLEASEKKIAGLLNETKAQRSLTLGMINLLRPSITCF
jgi:hypothetical protein